MTEEKEKAFTETLRTNILRKLEDLTIKIKENENLPHGEQDVHLLVGIDDRLDECLNNWYY